MKNKIFLSVLSITVLFACSNGNKDSSGEKQNMISQIDSLQKNMFNAKSMELDKNLAFKGIAAYQDFVKKFPEDSIHSAEYLFRMSDLLRAMGNYGKAIENLGQITKNYPSFKKLPECIFLQGYYSQEFFGDTIRAKEFYLQLISKYPTHAFAYDAKELMKMFGKSEQDIIKEFEKKEQEGKKK
ncbi:MAG: tetratricopeptide repeat protein [Bacteroidetes bacterium]|nr:tetratricopeptide repeat protein [Bacteroidota bacterium]